MIEHLKSRKMCVNRYYGISVDDTQNMSTFPLWNLSGQMVGYQTYRPDKDKTPKNDPKNGRYYTYVSGKKKEQKLGVWGVETLDKDINLIILTEGIFDACRFHNYGLPALATLSNNPKHLKSWLNTLPQVKVSVCDNDKAGRELAKMGDYAVHVDDAEDVGDMTNEQFDNFLEKIFTEIKGKSDEVCK